METSKLTTIFPIEVRCACCGHQSDQFVMGSTNEFGSPDLDLRPPEMKRSTMDCWLQECAKCRYIASSLNDPAPMHATDIVSSSGYREILANAEFPVLARRFLAYGMLVDHVDDEAAGLARLHAAWVCDDAGCASQAAACRSEAARALLRAKPFDDSDDGVTRGAVVVDVLRRAGQFDRAEAERLNLLNLGSAAGILRQVLEFEGQLIRVRDNVGYTVADVVK